MIQDLYSSSKGHEKPREEQIDFYLKVAQGYLEPLNIRLRLKSGDNDNDGGVIDEEPEEPLPGEPVEPEESIDPEVPSPEPEPEPNPEPTTNPEPEQPNDEEANTQPQESQEPQQQPLRSIIIIIKRQALTI